MTSPSTTSNGDTIIPIHEVDHQSWNKVIIMDATFRFDEVLNAQRLKAGLDRLLELGEWRKLGARINRPAGGIDEYRIPAEFTDKRPGFAFSHQTHNVAITEHPLGRKVPQARATTVPQTFDTFDDFASLVVAPDAPTRWKDWVNTDRPLLSMFIVHFHDATLVSFRWPHILLDAMGFKQMLDAWTYVLTNREDQVPTMVGFTKDPLASIPASKTLAATHLAAPLILKGAIFYLWLLRFIKELVLHPKSEDRVICLPSRLVSRLLSQTRQQSSEPHLSDSDILFAFWARLFVRAASASPSRSITMANVANLRGRLGDLLPEEQGFLGNAISLVVTQFSAHDILSLPLAQVALKVHEDRQEQLTRPQCEAMIAQYKTNKNEPAIWGPWNSMFVMLTNWHKGRFFDVALGERGEKPSYVGERFTYVGLPAMRNTGTVVGRDGEGNWWFRMVLRKGFWAKVEGYLKEENEKSA